MTKHIVCFSGGHSSALAAIEVARRFGTDDLILLNNDINPSKEDMDIKRFKKEVADYLGVPITYANILDITDPEKLPDQFDVCMLAGGFKFGNGHTPCTHGLKVTPFMNWLSKNHADKDVIIYYGFDAKEQHRVVRRRKILDTLGYNSDYPLALWTERTIHSTEEIGIALPGTYHVFKRANCIGCLKAGKQHWYIVYATRKDVWEKAKKAEQAIGYTIIDGTFLEELEPIFDMMIENGIPATEHIPHQKFWAMVRKLTKLISPDASEIPCECTD